MLLHCWCKLLVKPMREYVCVHPRVGLCCVVCWKGICVNAFETSQLLILSFQHWLQLVHSSSIGTAQECHPALIFLYTRCILLMRTCQGLVGEHTPKQTSLISIVCLFLLQVLLLHEVMKLVNKRLKVVYL